VDGSVTKMDAAGLRSVKSVDTVQQARFASSVGTDNGQQLAAQNLKSDVVQGFETTETQAQPMDA